MNDWELIQSYCQNGSESAFETLVKRHVDYVYCAALRQVRDPSLAEDVTQAVFLLLARKAKGFRSGTVLVSWLFRTTRFIATRALRSEYRRQRRELEAATMNPTTTTPESGAKWELVSPLLDEALAALPNKDRDAVLLRFIGRKPFSQVGTEIGASEDAAKKRVSRALARLREFFVRRGTTLSVAAIGLLLGERLVQASPAALAAKITSVAGAGGAAAASASATALLKESVRELFWTKVRWGAAISAGVAAVLFFASTGLRSGHDKVIISASPPPAAPDALSINSNREAAAGNTNSGAIASEHALSLLVARAEDEKPIPGARVLVESWRGSRPDRTLDATTDTNGLLEIPVPAHAFRDLRIWVSAEGRVPMISDWHAYEFTEPVVAHTILLNPGQTAAGTVVDESGNPVAGAKVYFEGLGLDLGKRDNASFHPDLSASFTDANGHWTTTQLPESPAQGQASICVKHPDFTPAQPGVGGLPGFPTNAILVLSNGVALRGRVMAADGTPVADAEVAKQSGAYWSTRTDTNGFFYWAHIEPGRLFVDVDAKGFETLHQLVMATNAANECLLTLTQSANSNQSTPASDAPPIRLHGTVADAESGEPIPSFRVLTGMGIFPSSWGEAMLPEARLLGEGHDGQFDWQIPSSTGGSQLEVEADGYLASVSEARIHDVADQEFNFKLRRGAVLTGQVVTPDGSPAANAVVSLTGPHIGPTMQRPGQLLEPNPGFEMTRIKTGRDGKFRLNLVTGARGVAVVHETGSALLTFAAATNAGIILQRWGSIDGTLYLGGRPAPNQTVSVDGTQKLDADPRVLFSFVYRTTTDDRGHFRFENLIPCEASVERDVACFDSGPSVLNFDHRAQVKVESGAVVSVELRGQGRAVIGRLVFQGSPDEVQWGMSTALLQGEKTFPFALSKDGTIRADDVPPETYKLSIRLARTSLEPLLPDRPPFGSLEEEVVVPPAEDQSAPVDLGELTVPRAK